MSYSKQHTRTTERAPGIKMNTEGNGQTGQRTEKGTDRQDNGQRRERDRQDNGQRRERDRQDNGQRSERDRQDNGQTGHQTNSKYSTKHANCRQNCLSKQTRFAVTARREPDQQEGHSPAVQALLNVPSAVTGPRQPHSSSHQFYTRLS